jgi:hypothetical protein
MALSCGEGRRRRDQAKKGGTNGSNQGSWNPEANRHTYQSCKTYRPFYSKQISCCHFRWKLSPAAFAAICPAADPKTVDQPQARQAVKDWHKQPKMPTHTTPNQLLPWPRIRSQISSAKDAVINHEKNYPPNQAGFPRHLPLTTAQKRAEQADYILG